MAPRCKEFLSCEALEDRLLLNGDPFAIGGDPRVHPDDFRITVFAADLNYPSSLLHLADGSLLVATNQPYRSSYFDSVGELLRLVDQDGDGVADGPGTVLYTGLPGSLTSISQAGSLLFVTSVQSGSEGIWVLRAGATPADPLSLVGSIRFGFPFNWEHVSFASAVRDNPSQPGDYDLFFNVGSQENFAQTTAQVLMSGLADGMLHGDGIYKVSLHDDGTMPVFYGLQQIATGLRNAAGIIVHPATGDLYFEDNGIDGLIDVNEPTSADELNVIAAANIGTDVFNFGFPSDYIEYRTGRRIGSGGIQPLVAFQPVPDPLNGSESEGPAGISFAPPGFPAGLNNGVFVGFHGRFDLGGLLNEENPVVYYDLGTGQYFHFIENDQPNIGHLDSVLATTDSLFLADLSSAGSTENGAHGGVIYQVQAISHGSRPPSNNPTLLGTTSRARDDGFAFVASRPAPAQRESISGPQEGNDNPFLLPSGVSPSAAQDAEQRIPLGSTMETLGQRTRVRATVDHLFVGGPQAKFGAMAEEAFLPLRLDLLPCVGR